MKKRVYNKKNLLILIRLSGQEICKQQNLKKVKFIVFSSNDD